MHYLSKSGKFSASVIKTIRNEFPDANISPIDYDPGASEANQTNRIKLLMTVAKDNLKKQQSEKDAIEKENKTTKKETNKKEVSSKK